ncbi:hypothetical protein, partial [Sphingomonas insulae]
LLFRKLLPLHSVRPFEGPVSRSRWMKKRGSRHNVPLSFLNLADKNVALSAWRGARPAGQTSRMTWLVSFTTPTDAGSRTAACHTRYPRMPQDHPACLVEKTQVSAIIA